jgi:hydroxyacylglutathione hydrolase
MNLTALPAFSDNYVWMLHDGTDAVVVDPGDEAPVLQALDALGLVLRGILVTHHHADHVGGVDALRQRLAGVVHGPARERIPAPYEAVREGDRLEVLGMPTRVIEVPGHTAGHVAYVVEPPTGAPWLFCGDTLFSAGCGRLFEGTPAQMLESLGKLSALPGQTRVCCTHEYTVANLRFARAVEPANDAVARALDRCTLLRASGDITLPSTLDEELRINPFLRCREPAVADSARAHGASDSSPVAVFAALREWKNVFR